MAGPVDLVGPDGREYTLESGDETAVADKVAKGFRLLTPETPRTTGEEVKGALADVAEPIPALTFSAMQGLSGGAYGAALGATHPEQKKEFQALEEEHPVASGVGSFAGMVLSPIGEVGGAISKGVGATSRLGRIAAGALGGAGEGALYGAGNTVSDAVLGDHALSAEKLISNIGLWSVLGGTGGAAGTAIGEAASALVPKLAKTLAHADESLGELADKKWLQVGGALDADIKKIPEWKKPLVADAFREHAPLSGDLKAGLDSMEQQHEALGKRIGELVSEADASGAKPQFDVSKYLADANPLERKAIQAKLSDVTGALAENEAKGGGFKGAHEIIRTLGKEANWKRVIDDEPIRNEMLKDLYREIRGDWEAQIAPHLGSDLSKEFLDANAKYGALSDAARITTKALQKGSYIGGFGDIMAVVAGGGGLHGLGAAVGRRIYNKFGPGLIARLADHFADSPALSTLASSFSQRVTQAAPLMGHFGTALTEAAAQSPQRALAMHMVMAQADPQYRQVALEAGFAPEGPGQQGASLAKANSLAQIAGAISGHDKELDRHIDAVFKGAREPHSSADVLKTQDFGSKRMRKEATDAHRTRADEIQQLASNPEALLERTANNLGNLPNVAPGLAAAMTAAAHRAVQYLAQVAQSPPKTAPLAFEWAPPEAQRHAFAQKLEAVQRPLSVLKHAAAGTLTKAHVEALYAVYPSLGRAIADRVTQRLTADPKSVPYRARLMLGMLANVDVDGSMSGAAVAANQTAIQSISKKPSLQAAAGQKSPQKGLESISLGDRTATPTQTRDQRARE